MSKDSNIYRIQIKWYVKWYLYQNHLKFLFLILTDSGHANTLPLYLFICKVSGRISVWAGCLCARPGTAHTCSNLKADMKHPFLLLHRVQISLPPDVCDAYCISCLTKGLGADVWGLAKFFGLKYTDCKWGTFVPQRNLCRFCSCLYCLTIKKTETILAVYDR